MKALRRCEALVRTWAVAMLIACGSVAHAQLPSAPATSSEATTPTPPGEQPALEVSEKVEVEPLARDEEIAARLERIMVATGWFQEPQVRVDEGIVFLQGRTDREQYKKWAGDLGRNTSDVVAVVNQLEVTEPVLWDFQPALVGLRELRHSLIYWFPYAVLALVIFVFTYGAARMITRVIRPVLMNRIDVSLLREVIARGIGFFVFLLGLYIVLRVCGLTRLALTVIGGTGLLGLVLGIAFRDIAENFLASILLSVQSPFRTGDVVEVAGVSGIVQQLNVRTTVLMAPTGNQVQIPNAIVYKSMIRNFTSNPNRRDDFVVGIGYDVSITQAQEIALKVLADHPAVLTSPEPWVLVDNLGPATVNLRVYFWIDGGQYSWLKVRSSIIRQIKRAFQDNDISMPDEVREVIFPQGVPMRMLQETPATLQTDDEDAVAPTKIPNAEEEVAVEAEGGLNAEKEELQEQADRARSPDVGENLLRSSDTATTTG